MTWKDHLPKAPLDAQRTMRDTGISSVDAWISLFSNFQAELPEPYAVIDVLDGDGADMACEALRALRRNPRLVRLAMIDMNLNRMWNINPVLHKISELVNPGTVLDLGCGAGRDSVWLAANGWEVTAVDRLESNLETLRKLRFAYAENDPIHWVQANLHEYRDPLEYDLALLHYCWDPAYFELAKRSVAENGYVSVLAHSPTHHACFGSLRDSKVIDMDKLETDGFHVCWKEEFWSTDRHSVSIVLRRG